MTFRITCLILLGSVILSYILSGLFQFLLMLLFGHNIIYMATVKARKFDFKEKTDGYAEICQMISHKKRRMRESCTSGLYEGHAQQWVCSLDY